MQAARIYLICFEFLIITFKAQTDSVMFQLGHPMNDAVFLTYWDFRHNAGILKDSIEFKGNKEQLDFITKALEQEQLKYKVRSEVKSIKSQEVWGYVQNNTFYINYQKTFYRIPVFGAISFLVAMVEVRQTGFYDPRFGTYSGGMVTTEQREFVMNFYDGKLNPLKQSDVEVLLSRDKKLFEEYSKLSNRKQKEQLYRFIRRYNENNPVYFLKPKE